MLLGLTATGQFHIHRLRLNRPPMVARRLEVQRNAILSQAIGQLRDDVQDLRQQLEAVEQALLKLRQRAH